MQLPRTDPTLLFRYRDGVLAPDLLAAALSHLDIFTVLAERPLAIEGMCEALRIHPRPADVLVTLLRAMGLLERGAGGFAPTPLAREFLVAGSPWDLRPYFTSLQDRSGCRSMLEVLRTGKPAPWGREDDEWARKMEDESFARKFTEEMDCRGRYLGPLVARALDLERRTRLLDVGGGSGIYACAIAEEHPQLRATVLERPPVDRIASQAIAARGLPDRVETVAGDMFVPPLPPGADVHLYSNVLHDWNEDQVRGLLAASFSALPPGGLLVIHDAFIDREKSGPLHVAEYSALLMLFTEGKCYSTGEYEDLLAETGFVDARHQDLAAARGLMTATKPA